jgi:hypothetical protein
VPASVQAVAGMRRHLRVSAAFGASVGAAESLVSFIRLFGSLSASPGADPYGYHRAEQTLPPAHERVRQPTDDTHGHVE